MPKKMKDELSAAGESTAQTPPNPTGGLPSSTMESPGPALDKLPSLDRFRKKFRDLVGAGVPISQCLDLGSVWNGMNSGNKTFLARDTFRKAFKDSIGRGKSIAASLKFATDQAGEEESGVGAESWVGGKANSTGYKISAGDKRVMFKGAVRDARKRGKGFRDAVGLAVDACDCEKK